MTVARPVRLTVLYCCERNPAGVIGTTHETRLRFFFFDRSYGRTFGSHSRCRRSGFFFRDGESGVLPRAGLRDTSSVARCRRAAIYRSYLLDIYPYHTHRFFCDKHLYLHLRQALLDNKNEKALEISFAADRARGIFGSPLRASYGKRFRVSLLRERYSKRRDRAHSGRKRHLSKVKRH